MTVGWRDMDGFRYNHDLLLDPQDLENARVEFPNIFPALDNPALRRDFALVDGVANRRKRISRRIGRLSVALVTIALIAAASSQLYGEQAWVHYVEALAAVLGLFGALLGFGGVLSRSAKDRWLKNRFKAERLRQFHFQSLTAMAPQILAAAGAGDWEAFTSERDAAYTAFHRALENAVQAKFAVALDDHANARSAESWVVQANKVVPDANPHLAELLRAYRKFRLIGQRDFAQLKITPQGRLFSSIPADQAKSLAEVGFYCVLALVALHLCVAGGAFFHLAPEWAKVMHVAAIDFAILALAFRTLDEGMQPHREVARYRAYRDSIRNITLRFDAAGATSAAHESMIAMEELAYDEMGSFLTSNHEARFVM